MRKQSLAQPQAAHRVKSVVLRKLDTPPVFPHLDAGAPNCGRLGAGAYPYNPLEQLGNWAPPESAQNEADEPYPLFARKRS